MRELMEGTGIWSSGDRWAKGEEFFRIIRAEVKKLYIAIKKNTSN